MVQNNDGTKPVRRLSKSSQFYSDTLQWLWVQNSNSGGPRGDESGAVEEASKLRTFLTQHYTPEQYA